MTPIRAGVDDPAEPAVGLHVAGAADAHRPSIGWRAEDILADPDADTLPELRAGDLLDILLESESAGGLGNDRNPVMLAVGSDDLVEWVAAQPPAAYRMSIDDDVPHPRHDDGRLVVGRSMVSAGLGRQR